MTLKLKKKVFSGIAAAGMLWAASQPTHVLAAPSPFFQYQKEAIKATQIAQYDSLVGTGGTEIVAYDEKQKRAYVTNGAEDAIDILSFEHLVSGTYTNINSQKRIALKDFGIENVSDITSVAVHPTENMIAVSVVSKPKTDPGYVVLLTKEGEFIANIQVGSLPDMVTFTPDGKKVLTADEGEPSDDYTVDPDGSVSMIDLTVGVDKLQAKTLTFHDVPMDAQVRLSSKGSVAQQMEPEYIVVSEDSRFAYVALQENNAIATIDLQAEQIVDVKGLGIKDHSLPGNELDGKRDGKTNIEKLPLLGFYMPDAIDLYAVDGKRYIVTPNEGDARDYEAYTEEGEIGDIIDQIQLNAKYYGGYTQSELDTLVADGLLKEMKKTKITLENGKVDGKYEALYSYGGRSFSIFDADTMQLVYDSGSDFEKIIADALPAYVNTDNKDISYDKRSSAKGPEPETVTIGELNGAPHAFIALERLSGIMVYDISNPKKPIFKTLLSSRDFTADAKGDVAPEGLRFVAAEASPTGFPLLLAAHELSGTVAVYEFGGKDMTRPFPFTDVSSTSWEYPYVKDLFDRFVVNGITEMSFAPQQSVTRAQFAALLARSLELKATSTTAQFSDAPEWAQAEIQALYEAGIVTGKEEGRFAPYDPITREQMAAMMIRAYESQIGSKVQVNEEHIYKDAQQISAFARADVQKAYQLGLMKGRETGDFAPKAASTRAQAAKVLSILHHQLEKSSLDK